MSVIPASFRFRLRSSIERPVAAIFTPLHLSPNALTLIGFGISVVGGYLAAEGLWLVAGLIVAFGAIFDLFDGALARATGKASRFGAFLDSTFDRAGEAAVYIGIALGFVFAQLPVGAVASMTAMAAAFMVSYTRAKAESLGFSSGRGMDNIGLAPREVRTAIVVIGLVATGLGGGVHTGWLGQGLGLIAVLATFTALERILFVHRQSKSQEVNE